MKLPRVCLPYRSPRRPRKGSKITVTKGGRRIHLTVRKVLKGRTGKRHDWLVCGTRIH